MTRIPGSSLGRAFGRVATGRANVGDPFGTRAGRSHCLMTAADEHGTQAAERVTCVRSGSRLYVRTRASGALARLAWQTAKVVLIPCGPLGRPLGPVVEARARVVAADKEFEAERALSARSPLPRFVRERRQAATNPHLLYLDLAPLGPAGSPLAHTDKRHQPAR